MRTNIVDILKKAIEKNDMKIGRYNATIAEIRQENITLENVIKQEEEKLEEKRRK
jgi:hypothetical protein